VFSRAVREAHRLATFLVGQVEQYPTGGEDETRCHELVAAIAPVLVDEVPDLRLMLFTGMYGPVEHSWLKVSSENYPFDWHVLDVYACGRLPQVQLIDGTGLLPESKIYRAANAVYAPRADLDLGFVADLTARFRALAGQVGA
jgi:hypothetical protein